VGKTIAPLRLMNKKEWLDLISPSFQQREGDTGDELRKWE